MGNAQRLGTLDKKLYISTFKFKFMPDYKYQDDINLFLNTCQCPENEYFSFQDKTAFRFVFEVETHPNNFIPPYKIKPKRFLVKSDLEKCKNLGLSLYAQKTKAIEAFLGLAESFPGIRKNIGTHIAEGNVNENDGHITEEDEVTHFDLYEFKGSDISTKFSIIEEL